MKQKLLLLSDVDDLGKKGEVVEVRRGFARNFLLPQRLAVIADIHTLRMQEKLKEERAKQAVIDRKDAEELAKKLEGLVLTIHVKVDPEGKMYGSVSHVDILELLEKEGYKLEKKNIAIKKSVKETGVIDIPIKLKEGVETSVKLKILPEAAEEDVSAAEVVAEIKEEVEEKKEETQPEKTEEKKEEKESEENT